MDAKQVLQMHMGMSDMVLKTYVSDLSDAELLIRPADKINHIAWQLGHLISAEAFLLNAICPGKAPALPEGFDAAHSKEKADSTDASGFLTKEKYLELYDRVRAASLAAFASCSAQDLAGPSPERFRERFPTVGDMFVLISTHPMMHVGQFVVLRRKLGKPVLI